MAPLRPAALACALLLCGCGVPGITSEQLAAFAPAPEVWLSGLVSDARTGGPLPEATLLLGDQTARSGADGSFLLERLAPGEQTLEVVREGYQPLSQALSLRAGANSVQYALTPVGCEVCRSGQVCDAAAGQCVAEAVLSGGVVNGCTGEGLDARVTIDGRSTCSTNGKAYFELKGLHPGGPYTLSIGKAGYKAFTTTRSLQAGLNTFEPVSLQPVDGCAQPPPPAACSCVTSNCG